MRLLFILAVAVNLSAINTAFFSDDPGLYGSVAKQLIYKHTFFQLYSYGHAWLDKPHFPFWLIWASFKLFSIHTWSYKLPALICFLVSLNYTWLFTKKYYNELTAIMAVLIVSTSLHIIMSNADVRAEPYLMAFIIGSIYHLSALEDRFNLKHFILAALLTAFAVMTKGIFVTIPIYGALGGQLLLRKKYREILRWRWVALVLLTIIFIIPELYGLYIQFDLHPEIIVRGRQHVSGIKWFLWDSQFGRFTNEGPITRPSGDIFFFVHTLLWAFAPWCLIFYYAVFRSVKKIVTGIKQPEYYALSGGIILLVLFSLSSFQLPFYTNIIFPLFAVVTASFCAEDLKSNPERIARVWMQRIYIILFPVVILMLHYFLHPVTNYLLVIDTIGLSILVLLILRVNKQSALKIFMLNTAVMLFVGFYVNTNLYPILVANNGQIKAAYAVNKTIPADQAVYSLKDQNAIFQFYCNRPVKYIQFQNFESTLSEKQAVFYADPEAIAYFDAHNFPYTVIKTFLDYPQEAILPAFINYKTRSTTLQKVYLIRKP